MVFGQTASLFELLEALHRPLSLTVLTGEAEAPTAPPPAVDYQTTRAAIVSDLTGW